MLCCKCLGDALLHSSSLLHVDPLEGTLTIKETLDVDAGVYTCVAVNAAGTASGKISLDVGGKSQIHGLLNWSCWNFFESCWAHIEDGLDFLWNPDQLKCVLTPCCLWHWTRQRRPGSPRSRQTWRRKLAPLWPWRAKSKATLSRRWCGGEGTGSPSLTGLAPTTVSHWAL